MIPPQTDSIKVSYHIPKFDSQAQDFSNFWLHELMQKFPHDSKPLTNLIKKKLTVEENEVLFYISKGNKYDVDFCIPFLRCARTTNEFSRALHHVFRAC